MPELPEVETVLRTLEQRLKQVTITNLHIYYEKIIARPDVATFTKRLVNETILAYHRLGKYLIFECRNLYLIVHLRMEGKFFIQDPKDAMNKHVHIIFDLDNGLQLRYHDTRKFGRMYLYPKQEPFSTLDVFNTVGLDVFDPNLKAIYLYQKSRKKKTTVKQFLLDQRNMAGVGNIYADEICFAIQLHPATIVSHLSKNDFEKVLFETRRILKGAVNAGGTTIRSYSSSLGVDGRFQLQLKVHNRKGASCPRCGNEIIKIKLQKRGTSFCKVCQKKK